MESAVLDQLLSAAVSLAAGAAFGIVYDFFKVLRLEVKSFPFTVLCDIVCCLTAFAGLFLLFMSIGGGQARLYMALCFVLGAVLYFATASPAFLGLFASFVAFAVRIFRFILRPIKILAQKAKILFQKTYKWFTIRVKARANRLRAAAKARRDARQAKRQARREAEQARREAEQARLEAEQARRGAEQARHEGQQARRPKKEHRNEAQKSRYNNKARHPRPAGLRGDIPVRPEAADRAGKGPKR
jgi:hypothetical protein